MSTTKKNKSEKSENPTFVELVEKISQESKSNVKTPIQTKNKSGVVKRKMDRFNFNLPADHLKSLKKLALDEDTTVTNLLISAYADKYNIK